MMDAGTAQQVLVIILSAMLAIFLVVAITLGILAIRLVNAARLMVERAEKAVDSAEAVGKVIKDVITPVGILRMARMLRNIISRK